MDTQSFTQHKEVLARLDRMIRLLEMIERHTSPSIAARERVAVEVPDCAAKPDGMN
jgi:hypothetical protein